MGGEPFINQIRVEKLMSQVMTSQERYDLIKQKSAEYRSLKAQLKESQAKLEVTKRVRKQFDS